MNKLIISLIAVWIVTVCVTAALFFIEDKHAAPASLQYIDSLESSNDSLRKLTNEYSSILQRYADSLTDLKIKLQYFKGRQDYHAQENENIIRMTKYVKSLKDGTWVDQSKEEARADALLKDLVIFDSK